MRAEDADAGYLWHMLWAARVLNEMVAGLEKAQYLSPAERRTRMAVERGLEVIGEAANRVSNGFKAAHPDIPWSQIIGQRNIIAHMYYDLKQEEIWESATIGVPELIALLEPLLPAIPPDPEPGG